jgi:predicted TIM-barrel fold metal-dependent hydrolase
MKIDVHAHYWTEDYIDLLVDLGQAGAVAVRGLGAGGGTELEARLRLMDRAGVQMQVLSACPQMPYGEDGQKAATAARFVNDQYASLVQDHPDRFRAFAALPMPHLQESLGEMGRALDELGLTGVAMNTTVLDRALVEPEYEPVYGWEAPDTPERPSVAARRMWYDTVGHGHVPALRCAIDSFGADRLVLGTDFPYENGDTFVRAVDYIRDPQIAPAAARAILDQNAGALLGIDG